MTAVTPENADRLPALVREMNNPAFEDRETLCQLTSEIIRITADALIRLMQDNPRFREPESLWLTPAEKSPGRRDANAFLLACFLEYRSGNTDICDNVAFFVEDVLRDPENLWRSILDHDREGWEERFYDYSLHPVLKIHTRLYDIATRMVRFYAGDGRQIWTGYEDNPEEVFKRLLVLQIPKSVACLVVGMLKYQGYIRGSFDIVGDIVDSRVLGRMVCGDGSLVTSLRARRLARMLAPGDPWILDRPLYLIGSTWCGPGPKCRVCPVQHSCVAFVSERLGIRPDPVFRELLFGKKTVQKTLRTWQ